MKTAHITWEEVKQRAGDQVIQVYHRGVRVNGKPTDPHMIELFGDSELLQMTKTDFQVMESGHK